MPLKSALQFDNPSDKLKLKGFFKQLTVFSGGNLLAQLVMMVYTILVARALGSQNLGVYSGIYAFLGVTITAVNYGMDNWMLKVSEEEKPTAKLTGKVLSAKLLVGALWLLLCVILLPLLGGGEFLLIYSLLAALEVLTDVSFNTLLAHFNITREIKRYNSLLLASRIGKLLGVLLLMALQEVSVLNIILSRLAVSLLIFGISFMIAKPRLVSEPLAVQVDQVRALRKTTAPYGISEILAMVYGNADVAVLSFYSTAQAGLYSPASGVIHALFILPNAFYNYLLPVLVKRENQKDQSAKRADSVKVVLLFSALGLLLMLGVAVFAAFILVPLLGASYQQSRGLLLILSPIMLFKSLSFGFAALIVVKSLQAKRLLPQLIVAVLDLVLVVLLIPSLGAKGVAWAYLLSELLLCLGYWLILIRHRKEAVSEAG